MIICDTGVVIFPNDRNEQAADLMTLAGDALLRGDRIAWSVLYRASKELEAMPEFDSPEGEAMSADLGKRLSVAMGNTRD